MTLRLSDKQTAALKKAAEQESISMQEAALKAVDEYLSKRQMRLQDYILKVATEDKELFDRLAK